MALPTAGATHIDALLSGWSWTGTVGAGVSLDYTFGAASELALDQNLEAAVTSAVKNFTEVARVGFDRKFISTLSTSTQQDRFINGQPNLQSEDIIFRTADLGDSTLGLATFPFATSGPPTESVITAVDVDVAPDGTNLGPGTEPYVTLLHEIGHALGLSHTDSGESQSGVSLSPAEQTTDATVMNSTFPDFNPGDFTELVRPHSLMIYDVAALQYLYGANTTFRTGNDTYEFNGGTTEARTIWDAGGIDTYSTVTFTGNAVIDLREGFENVTQVSHAAGTGSFIWSAFGANIENATAGGGNDSIFGNSLNNRLRGNDGNDSIVAGAGDDDLNGNRGADSIMGGDGNDIVRGGKDNDTVHGDAGMDDIHGDVGDDIVFGGADNDMVNGNIGSDIIIGDSGNDTIRGGQGDDQIFGGEGIDTIFGDKGNDRLNGGGGGDIFIFRPGFGADILEGFDLPGAGIGDRLQISSSLATTASEVLGKATLNADSVFIDFTGGNTITILGISTLGLDDITIV